MAGLTVAQISEFSIVFVAMGITLGHVGTEALGLTTLVGLVTIALSTYMILYSHKLYGLLAPVLTIFERKHPHRELAASQNGKKGINPDVIVFGLGRYGSRLAFGLKDAGFNVLGVDFDPEVVQTIRRKKLQVQFGDGIEQDFIDSLPLKGSAWIVSTLPDVESNRGLIRALRAHHYEGRIAVVAREEPGLVELKKLGAVTVLYPMNDAVDYAVTSLTEMVQAREGNT